MSKMEWSWSKVNSLTMDLLQGHQRDYDDTIDQLFSEVPTPEEVLKIPDPQMEDCAVHLWNWTATKSGDTSISNNQKAKVRSVACSLLYCCEPVNPAEGVIRKQILMASKTGRTWMDCNNPKMAEKFFQLALKSLESLYNTITIRGIGAADVNSAKGDVEKDLLRILSCQAESAISQGNNKEAMVCIQRCKDMLLRLPKDTAHMSLLCYNFGVETFKLEMYEDSSIWLSQSYEIGKLNLRYGPGSEVLARVLRLLSIVYINWDVQRFQDKALNAVSLANKECVSSCGLLLKVRVLLRCGGSDNNIRAALNEMLNFKVSLEECLSTVTLLMSKDRELLAFEHLKHVCQYFESSPDLGSALVLHIKLLLQKGQELLGKQKIEDLICGHHTGTPLTQQAVTSLHAILWDKASKHFEEKRFQEALQWYNYSLSFFKAGQMEPILAKLQRNRASCFLHLKQLEKANDAIKEAERCEPDSIFTQFSIFKIAVNEKNATQAEAVNQMAHLARSPVTRANRLLVSEAAASNLLSLAAQIALENELQETAVKALASLCEISKDEHQVLTSLRCLIRLLYTTTEKFSDERSNIRVDMLLPYLNMALKTISQQFLLTDEQRTHAADWFRKTAWNSALLCESSPDKMRDFFVLSYQFSQLCPPDRTLLIGQKTCLLMAVAASLELCRQSPLSNQIGELTWALEYTKICKEIWKTLIKSGYLSVEPTETILLLYEFEARVKLNDPMVETVLESVLELEHLETKVLEIIAALAMEPPAHFPLLCKKALRAALSLHKKQPQADLAQCRCIHSLIELSLPSGVTEVEAPVLEEVWDYYEEALSIITAAPNDIPEMEKLWLLTRAWNTGVLLYSLAQYPEAEKWCGLAMSFVYHLGSLQERFETQMLSLYREILDRLDKAKKKLSMQELTN